MDQLSKFVSISLLISAGNPLELIKSRIQTMNEMIDQGTIHRRYKGIYDCVKAIKFNEGVKALWKGNSISIVRFFPNQSLNNNVKNHVRSWLPSSYLSNIVSGVTGGWVASAILYPVDTARIILSTSVKSSSQTSKQILKKVRKEGVRFLYQGYTSSMLNIGLFRGAYFGMFDSFKEFCSNDSEKWVAAYTAGLTAGFAVYPVQTIRKRKIIGRKDDSYKKIIKNTFYKQGIRGFYRGCALTPLQSLTGAAVLMYFDQKNKTV